MLCLQVKGCLQRVQGEAPSPQRCPSLSIGICIRKKSKGAALTWVCDSAAVLEMLILLYVTLLSGAVLDVVAPRGALGSSIPVRSVLQYRQHGGLGGRAVLQSSSKQSAWAPVQVLHCI